MQEVIRFEDLVALREARFKAELALKDVELIQARLFHRYDFKEGDTFNADTGLITRTAPPAPAPESPQA